MTIGLLSKKFIYDEDQSNYLINLELESTIPNCNVKPIFNTKCVFTYTDAVIDYNTIKEGAEIPIKTSTCNEGIITSKLESTISTSAKKIGCMSHHTILTDVSSLMPEQSLDRVMKPSIVYN